MDPSILPGGDWEGVYRQTPVEDLPWFSPRLDADFERALQTYRVHPRGGPVLDLGTGPGTAAIELTRRKFAVAALDVSPTAIEAARRRAGPLASKIEWIAADLFAQTWDERFQLVYDRGVYHSLPLERRHRYPDVVAPWLRRGGLLFVKTFSPDEPGDWGPFRISREELESTLGGRLDLIHLEPSTFPGRLDHEPKAWFAVFRRPR